MTVKKKFVLKKSGIRIYDAGGDLNKRWFIEWKNQHLKTIRSYKGINTHRSAAARYAAIDSLIAAILDEHHDPYSDSPRMIQHMNEYIQFRSSHLREKSHQTYQSRLKVFADWYQGQHIDARNASLFLDYLTADLGRSYTTRNDYRTFMKSVWKWMVKRGYYQNNPWLDTDKTKSVSIPARAFSSVQIAHLKRIMETSDPDLWLFCQMMFYTFIRPGEIRKMVVADLLFDERKILVRSEISKNGKEEFVIMPHPFVPVLQQKFLGADPTLFLFSSSGCPGHSMLGKNTMSTRHRKLLQGLNYSSQHKLYSWKHTGAKQAVMAGINVKELQLQLRHHSLDQVDQYLKSLGVQDLSNLAERFPQI